MDKIKKYIYIGIAILIAVLLASLYITIKENDTLKDKWRISEENIKTYDEQLSDSKIKNRAYKLTIEQLNYFNDSILEKLNEARKELKIKDDKLKSLQYVSTVFTKTDTIILNDTIFKDPQVNVDTVISDEWYTVNLGLRYPSEIRINPIFKSEKFIVVSSRKETINPPKKCWLFRLFQKKQTVLQVDVIERNPYIKDASNKYIEIVD